MNIILVVIDTLRYDHVGACGNDWVRTPNLDRIASQSHVFDRCFSASLMTIPYRLDLMTGRTGGPFHPWRPLAHDAPALPRDLAEAGYRTQLIHDTPHLVNGGHNFDFPFQGWTFVRGAEVDRPWVDSLPLPPEGWPRDPVFDFMDDYRFAGGEQCYPLYMTYFRSNRDRKREEDWNAARLFLTASKWLRENAAEGANRGSFFLWIDCFDPHEPWDVPPEYVKMYDRTPGYDGRIDPRALWVYRTDRTPTDPAADRLRCLYAAKVTWMDRWLGELLKALEQTGLDRSTTLIVTADHGTRVGENGVFGKQFPISEAEGHVPLFIRTPDREHSRSTALVQAQDIHATVRALGGLPASDAVAGRDLLGEGTQRWIALSGSPQSDRWKSGIGVFTVFDGDWCLEAAADPRRCRLTQLGSIDNVAGEHPDVVSRLLSAGVDELAARGADPALVSWLKSEGTRELHDGVRFSDALPLPAGYEVYFRRNYFGR
jgi:arylsulfatase A-like enzyme